MKKNKKGRFVGHRPLRHPFPTAEGTPLLRFPLLQRIGFTLVELSVVVLIIAILASIGVPQYLKTVEISKATNAAGITHMVASANRMYHIDNPGSYASGTMANGCGTDCAGATSACKLIACNYLIDQDWDKAAYSYTAENSGGIAASSKRQGTCSGDYCNWGYTFSTTGECDEVGGAPACPVF